MTVTPEIIRMARAARDRTVELNNQQVVDLTRAWITAWEDLEPEFRDALVEVLADADGIITHATMNRNRRIAQALQHAGEQLDHLTDYTRERVGQDLGTIVLDAANTHYETLRLQLPPEAPGAYLGRLDTQALDAMVARTTQQIHASSIPLTADAVAAMKRELMRGHTIGINPNATARRIIKNTEGAFNGGLTRAVRIARTEALDVQRVVDQQTATMNRSVIAARVWTATLDAKTCGSCLAQHGTEWPVDAFGPEDHQQGRCIFVDRTKTWAELGFTGIEEPEMDLTGERDEWWANLTDRAQDSALGKDRANLLRNGDITWDDLSTKKDNPNWRPAYYETPVKALKQKAGQ